jgi:hypothetical protein
MQQDITNMICPNCKRQVNSNTNYCSFCGEELKNDKDETKKEIKPNIKKEIPHQGLLIAILTILGLLIIGYISNEFEFSNSSFKTKKRRTSVSTNNHLVTMYAHQEINIRKGRSTKTPIVGKLRRGEKIQTGFSLNNWIEVYRFGKSKGFVYDELLKNYPVPDFEILSWNWVKDYNFGVDGAIIWTVEVQNNTNNYIDHLRVEITTYDKNGKIMTSDYTFVKGLSPGGTASNTSYSTFYGGEKNAKVRIIP